MQRILTLCAATIFLIPAIAAAERYELDPVHSVAVFKIKHLGVSYTYGLISDLTGNFTFDPAAPAKSAISVSASAANLTTRHPDRDAHLLNPDFLNAEAHPTLTFNSTAWEKVDDNHFEITGDLTILGVTKPIVVKAELVGCANDPKAGFRCGFDTTFTIKRSSFGMNTFLGPVGDEVTVTIGIEGIQEGTMPAEEKEE